MKNLKFEFSFPKTKVIFRENDRKVVCVKIALFLYNWQIKLNNGKIFTVVRSRWWCFWRLKIISILEKSEIGSAIIHIVIKPYRGFCEVGKINYRSNDLRVVWSVGKGLITGSKLYDYYLKDMEGRVIIKTTFSPLSVTDSGHGELQISDFAIDKFDENDTLVLAALTTLIAQTHMRD